MNQSSDNQVAGHSDKQAGNKADNRAQIRQLGDWLNSKIIGQEQLTNRLLIALLANGHLLVEGAPGLAKTRAIKSLAEAIEGSFHRIQFTPDLLPGDITGTDIFRPEDASFVFQPGPVFHHLVLADEINRAPAKVQSALLEAMAERQVSVGRKSYPLPELFLVMATQNPIEQEGTYPLPEAQLDRFLMQVNIDYPGAGAEKAILQLSRREEHDASEEQASVQISQQTIFAARREILEMHLSDPLEDYIVQMILATRNGIAGDNDIKHWLSFGASPRGTIALDRCARAHAWLQGKDYVSPDDIQAVAKEVLRHRIILSFEAEANDISADDVVERIIQLLPVA
jgi:MoxR-like ATPase